MKKLSTPELRQRLLFHWKQKIKYAYRYLFNCSLYNKWCDKCKEEKICSDVRSKKWLPIGKL